MIVRVVRALNNDVKVTIIVIQQSLFPYNLGKCGRNWLQRNVINVNRKAEENGYEVQTSEYPTW